LCLVPEKVCAIRKRAWGVRFLWQAKSRSRTRQAQLALSLPLNCTMSLGCTINDAFDKLGVFGRLFPHLEPDDYFISPSFSSLALGLKIRDLAHLLLISGPGLRS
jgi:hypothetical protein